MKMCAKGTLAALILGSLILTALPALADTYSPEIDWRQYQQQQRILQGAQSGQITPREYARLERQQARIAAAEARMKADGRFTRRERVRLNHRLGHSSAHIFRARHNGRVVR
jgi:hypothetical protein